MGKKNKISSSARDDDVEIKKHKKSHVEADRASTSKSLKSGKGVLKPCSKIKVNLKKQKKHKEKSEEIKGMKKSIEQLTEAVKILQETLLTKLDVLEMVPLKENNTQEEEEEEEDMDKCCFDCKEAKGNDYRTIYVKGFQYLRTRNEIKKSLSSVFGKCGAMIRVFVPIECKTRVPLGFAFINYKDGDEGVEKALELNGSMLQGRKLVVKMASQANEFYGYTNFAGCERCQMSFFKNSEEKHAIWRKKRALILEAAVEAGMKLYP